MALISGISVNLMFITEILLEKEADVRDILFYRYRSFKKMSFYIDVNRSIIEAAIAIAVNTIRTLDIFVIIYTAFIYS